MAFAHKFSMDLNETVKGKTGKGKREKVGSAVIPCPVLSDFGFQVKQALETEADEKAGKKVGDPMVDESGLPVYEEPKFQWLQDAIKSAVMVKVRNKFDKGNLKPGQSIPQDFDELCASSGRSGEALALRRDARTSFEAFLLSLKKKQEVVSTLGELFWNSNKVLGTVSEKYLDAIAHYSERWIAQLDEAQRTRFAPKIAELEESINNARSEDDLMDGEQEEQAA